MLRALSLCTCCRHYPGAAAGRRRRSSHPAVSAFPDNVVGSACTSSFSRPAQRSLALRPAHSRRHLYVTCYTEGFSHFVTSMTAPVASGWSVWPGGARTHWKAPPCHGAHVKRTLPIATAHVAVGGKAADRGAGIRPNKLHGPILEFQPRIRERNSCCIMAPAGGGQFMHLSVVATMPQRLRMDYPCAQPDRMRRESFRPVHSKSWSEPMHDCARAARSSIDAYS